ncbi:hypothetical protein T09_83, partial [Trichinella sp. T9]
LSRCRPVSNSFQQVIHALKLNIGSPDERTNGILLYFLMGWSRPVSRYSYCSLTALFYWAIKSLYYWFPLSNCSLIQIFPL